MYFLGGFAAGLCLLYLGDIVANRIQFWLWKRREHPLGVHLGFDEITQHCNEVINEVRRNKREVQ